MHAHTIEAHQTLSHQARELAEAWAGTDPMHSEDDVRRALAALDQHPPDGIIPYLVDACREAGLLIPGDEALVEAVQSTARRYAAVFGEFGEPMDPDEGDWDFEAWSFARAELGIDRELWDQLWPVYQRALVSETEALCRATT